VVEGANLSICHIKNSSSSSSSRSNKHHTFIAFEKTFEKFLRRPLPINLAFEKLLLLVMEMESTYI